MYPGFLETSEARMSSRRPQAEWETKPGMPSAAGAWTGDGRSGWGWTPSTFAFRELKRAPAYTPGTQARPHAHVLCITAPGSNLTPSGKEAVPSLEARPHSSGVDVSAESGAAMRGSGFN